MSYKQNASANRDALFGASGSKKSGNKSSKSKRSEVPGRASSGGRNSAGTPASTSRPSAPSSSSSKGYQYGAKKNTRYTKPSLSGQAKEAKMKEAEDYRDKAKKAMQKGIFSKPDPLAASTYYKRAADSYQLCGELRLERLYRINSADCQCRVGAWATAATEYSRAAALVEEANDETIEAKREIGRKLHLNAADAWQNANEPGKAASCRVDAALALIWGDESRLLPRVALQAVEESVESFVPDPLNPYARYRQTGVSAYSNPDSEGTMSNFSAESMELAEQHIVTRPFAHESVQEVVYLLVTFGEYASALYATGAASTLLSQDGVSTLSLSRAFVAETIVTLAMGDPIAAEENFLNRHVQKSSYLTSRECKLAEELFRAVKTRDGDALEEARSRTGGNRAAIGNLHDSLRELVEMIRLSGVAKKGVESSAPREEKTGSSKKKKKRSSPTQPKETEEAVSLENLASKRTGYEKEADEADAIDGTVLQDELDALDFGDDESDTSDDSLDLR